MGTRPTSGSCSWSVRPGGQHKEKLWQVHAALQVTGAKVVRSQFKRELEILDRNTFTQAKESVVNLLCKREVEVSTALECLGILV